MDPVLHAVPGEEDSATDSEMIGDIHATAERSP